MMLTFDAFQSGAVLGTVTFEMNDDRIACWEAIFPEERASGDHLPPGLVISIMMRGYIHILGDRPDGNVHAGQELHWLRPAPAGARLVVGLTCLRTELKGQRRWVWLENSVGSESGEMYLRGTMRMLWAR